MGVTIRDQTANQLTGDRLTKKLFVFSNSFVTVEFLNNTGAELQLVGGEVLGRVAGTLQAIPINSAVVTGAEFVLGVNATSKTLAIGEAADVSVCVSGDVAEDLLIFIEGDTLDTLVLARPYRDRFGMDTMGMRPVAADELTKFDN